MLWECNECGGVVRRRPSTVCHHCGIAGATFVRIDQTESGMPDTDSMFNAWFRSGMERNRRSRHDRYVERPSGA